MTRMTTERFFGGVVGRIENLQLFLEFVSDETPTETELVEWITRTTEANSEETVRRNIRFLETIDLIAESDGAFETTNKGEAFWQQEEPQVMYKGLAQEVDGFRTITRSILEGHRSLGEIQTQLQNEFPDFELPEGVISKHTDWLKSLDLLIEEDGEWYLPIEYADFEVGKTYSRWFIHDVFKGQRYRGIATPSDHPLIFIFTGDSGRSYGYDDEWLENGNFVYTGEGAVGDMTMDGGNQAIRDHAQNDEIVHLFDDTDIPWMVTYLGEFEYVGHDTKELPDENDELREAIRFELSPTTDAREPGSTYDPDETASDLRPPKRKDVQVSRIVRNTAIVRDLKNKYEHRCQVCGDARKKGISEAYAEGHHLHPLGDNPPGPDIRANIVILCPNHHADFDFGLVQIDPDSMTLEHAYDESISGTELYVHEAHNIDEEFIDYHNQKSVPLDTE